MMDANSRTLDASRTMRCRLLTLALLVLGTPDSALDADEPKGPKEFAPVKYRNVGPFAGGRVSRACGVPGDPLTYYAATASGGVWKSTDGGLTWKPIFDDQPTSSIGSIAVAPSDPNVVYVGTGEANIRGNVAPGAGIFKSTDAGKTWTHVWKQVGQIGTITRQANVECNQNQCNQYDRHDPLVSKMTKMGNLGGHSARFTHVD